MKPFISWHFTMLIHAYSMGQDFLEFVSIAISMQYSCIFSEYPCHKTATSEVADLYGDAWICMDTSDNYLSPPLPSSPRVQHAAATAAAWASTCKLQLWVSFRQHQVCTLAATPISESRLQLPASYISVVSAHNNCPTSGSMTAPFLRQLPHDQSEWLSPNDSSFRTRCRQKWAMSPCHSWVQRPLQLVAISDISRTAACGRTASSAAGHSARPLPPAVIQRGGGGYCFKIAWSSGYLWLVMSQGYVWIRCEA